MSKKGIDKINLFPQYKNSIPPQNCDFDPKNPQKKKFKNPRVDLMLLLYQELTNKLQRYLNQRFIEDIDKLGRQWKLIRKAAKKNLFLVARPLRTLSPSPPLRLGGHMNFFPYIKKKSFFLSGTPV